jgi:hypothetical protein
MKFDIKGPLKDNIYNALRDASYHFAGQDEKTGELEFTHSIRGNAFPRFHLFIKVAGDVFTFSLHLDQKAPVYRGGSAHQGEYDGALIEEEAQRINKQLKMQG